MRRTLRHSFRTRLSDFHHFGQAFGAPGIEYLPLCLGMVFDRYVSGARNIHNHARTNNLTAPATRHSNSGEASRISLDSGKFFSISPLNNVEESSMGSRLRELTEAEMNAVSGGVFNGGGGGGGGGGTANAAAGTPYEALHVEFALPTPLVGSGGGGGGGNEPGGGQSHPGGNGFFYW